MYKKYYYEHLANKEPTFYAEALYYRKPASKSNEIPAQQYQRLLSKIRLGKLCNQPRMNADGTDMTPKSRTNWTIESPKN